MTLNAKEKIEHILKKLADRYFLGEETGRVIEFNGDELLKGTNIKKEELQEILGRFKQEGLIEGFSYWNGDDAVYLEEPDYDIYGIHFTSAFSEKVKNYFYNQPTVQNTQNNILLYLDAQGNFWHGDKNKNCYQMGLKGNRYLILKYLAENKGFQDTASLAQRFSKDKQGVRGEIGKIKANIKKFLQINDVIASQKDGGYSINEKYKIVLC